MAERSEFRRFGVAFSFSLLFIVPVLAQPADSPDTLGGCSWSAAPVFPVPVLDSAATTVGGILYSFGGVSNTVVVANSYRFNGSTWTPIASLPAALEFPAAVNDGTNIYILGGAAVGTGTPQTSLYRYNVAANNYTTLASFTTGTWNHAAVYLNGKIYKFTGTGPATASTDVLEIYDVAGNAWSLGAVYPLAISFVGAWEQGGFIYAAGGYQSAGSLASLKTYRYDPAANTWNDAAIADLPQTRWGAAAALYSDGVLAGGYVAGSATGNISNTVTAWDLPSNTWQSLPNMLGERARTSGAVLNGSFFVVGGRSVASSAFVGTNDNQQLLCSTPGICNVNIAAGPSPVGYLPLSAFGIPPVAGVTDDIVLDFDVPAFTFAGETYTRVGFSSNGYAVIGGSTGPADNSLNNQNFPDLAHPNNVLAPFWTDLNPAGAGELRIGALTDGVDTWIVMDWANVREFSTANSNSFEIWIGQDNDAHPAEDVSFAYGPIGGSGNGGFLTAGAENKLGTRGKSSYFNGTGTLPAAGADLRVTTTSCALFVNGFESANTGAWSATVP